MRIRFVLHSAAPTGGLQVVLRHARALRERGHEVLVIWPAARLVAPWAPGGWVGFKSWWRARTVDRTSELLGTLGAEGLVREVPAVVPDSVPPGDVLVATAWPTAEWLAQFPAAHGARCYFLQGYEAYVPELEARVDATWRLPFTRIALSQWLVDLGRERLGLDCAGPVGNGIDSRFFHPLAGPRPQGRQRVGAVYDPLPMKGLPVLLEAIDAIAAARPDVEFLLFGRSRLRHRLPARARFRFNPAWSELPALYGSLDVFLHATLREGWGLPPMEAMASGVAVAATRTGGVPEFADERSARIVEPGNAPALAAAALGLLADAGAAAKLGELARERVKPFTWEAATARLEAALLAAAGA